MRKRYDQKLTNPKDMLASSKLPIHLVPDSMVVYASMAFLEGALKYGQYNWRRAGVRFSIYWSAFERHRMKLCAGEWCDKKTGIPHIASMLACLGIIVDAHVAGKLTDDRPPAQPVLSWLIDLQESRVKDLKELFSEHNPHQHTILDEHSDSPRRTRTGGPRRQLLARRSRRAAVRRSKNKGSHGNARRKGKALR